MQSAKSPSLGASAGGFSNWRKLLNASTFVESELGTVSSTRHKVRMYLENKRFCRAFAWSWPK
eukprot:9081892-Lingulodinium_polyedra.AAC.1